MSEAPIRVGILGAARIAPAALIDPARARSDVHVVTVAARDPARATAFAAAHGLDDACDDYAALVARDDLDLVYVALPPDLHCRWSIAALEAGKAVLCEKPFALDADEAQRMVDAADRSGGVLIEGFHYRFHALMRKAVAIVRDGLIGDPVGARASVNYPIPTGEGEPRWSAAHGGGAIMDLGCYGLHALRTLLGVEPRILAARTRWERGVDAASTVRLAFGDLEAQLSADMAPPEPSTDLVIEGTRGRLQINGLVLPQRSGRLRLTADGPTRDLPIEGASSYAAQLDHVVGVLRGREVQLTGGADAIANMRAIDSIRAMARASEPAA